MKIVAEWSPEDMIPAHISQAFSLICSIFNSGILFPPPLSSDLNPAFAMMKTIQAIIHCSDGVVILVHAEGDVGQSPVWKTADYILMPVTSQKPHILACDVPTILRNCDHMWCLCNIFWQARKRNWRYGNPRKTLTGTMMWSVELVIRTTW